MSAVAWCAWLAMLLVPWLACAATATCSAAVGRTATRTVGFVWCLAAVALMVLTEAPHSMVFGPGFVLPSAVTEIHVTVAATMTRFSLWGVGASGLALWWLAGSPAANGRATNVLVQLIAGFAAQVWFLDNAWWLLIVQTALTGLCALLLGWDAERPNSNDAASSLWIAGAWADGMQMLALCGAAVSLATWDMSALSDAGRIAELQSASPEVVSLVGLLWGIAICGRLYQFPFCAVRDLSALGSSLANGVIWGVGLLPLAARWIISGSSWWSQSEVLADLMNGWSAITVIVGASCAVASKNLRVRLTWLLGVQGGLAIPTVLETPIAEATELVVEPWAAALAAAAWLFGGARPGNRQRIAGAIARMLSWVAAANVCGIILWPVAFPADEFSDWREWARCLAMGLCGLATVQVADQVRREQRAVQANWDWDSGWLVVLPLVAATAAGRFGEKVLVQSVSTGALLAWLMAAVGVVAGLLWQTIPGRWRENDGLVYVLIRVARQRFATLQLIRYCVGLPVLGLAQLCRVLDELLFEAGLFGMLRRLQQPMTWDLELQTAGSEFYALALGLTAAAMTLTVMWLAQ